MLSKLYKKLKEGSVQCLTCANYCLLREDQIGKCGLRQNRSAKLYFLPGKTMVTENLDPIEKKPLFHFLPGSSVLSLGGWGCNLGCSFCQNWELSQAPQSCTLEGLKKFPWGDKLDENFIINYCLKNNIPSIAYTYNEPTVYLDAYWGLLKKARANGLKNIWVTNGYLSKESFETLRPYLDAVNIDLKGFTEKFYKNITGSHLNIVKENIKKFVETGIWTEVTTLVIPGLNDSLKELSQIANFIASISIDIPWHLSAFYPAYKLNSLSPTSPSILKKAYIIGKTAGLNYVYTGNLAPLFSIENTFCPKCQFKLVERQGYVILINNLIDDHCPNCGYKIAGIWK
ncbi:MAG: AmmeMemoRadiSam system radical SAM enzyme [Candidatus Parcubacteria bacterium]|nr:AmmeMemoRadiSam system radical SAM enzyme [Candidatus Parcubacteria bacterium]